MSQAGPLAGAAAREDHGQRLQDELEVLPQAPVIDVLHVQVHPLLERDLIATAHLPDARQAGSNGKPPALPGLVLRDLYGDRRARTHDAHLAAEDIDELGKLVDAVLADETADPGDARVTAHLE